MPTRQPQVYFALPSTDSLKVLATEKPTFFLTGILIGSPVWGFRPMRAFILRSRKMPNPGILTDSPFLTLFWTVSTRQSSISSPCLRLTPPASASFVTNCAFVIAAPPSLGTRAERSRRNAPYYGKRTASVKKTRANQGLARYSLTPDGSPTRVASAASREVGGGPDVGGRAGTVGGTNARVIGRVCSCVAAMHDLAQVAHVPSMRDSCIISHFGGTRIAVLRESSGRSGAHHHQHPGERCP